MNLDAKFIKRHFSKQSIELGLWVKTIEGAILRVIRVGTKNIALMDGAGKKTIVQSVVSVAKLVSDL